MTPSNLSAADVIRLLDLAPHPEGGHYRETFRDSVADASGRAASTAIYFLLAAGEVSRWHRIDAAEVWHWYAGAPLALTIADAETRRTLRLGTDLASGERPQAVVPAGAWQQAASLGALDARRLQRCTRLPVHGVRAGPAGLRSAVTAEAAGGQALQFCSAVPSWSRDNTPRVWRSGRFPRSSLRLCSYYLPGPCDSGFAWATTLRALQFCMRSNNKAGDSGAVDNEEGSWRAVPQRGVR